jgi:hypothetical protein
MVNTAEWVDVKALGLHTLVLDGNTPPGLTVPEGKVLIEALADVVSVRATEPAALHSAQDLICSLLVEFAEPCHPVLSRDVLEGPVDQQMMKLARPERGVGIRLKRCWHRLVSDLVNDVSSRSRPWSVPLTETVLLEELGIEL